MPPPEPFHLLFQEALKKRDLIPHTRPDAIGTSVKKIFQSRLTR